MNILDIAKQAATRIPQATCDETTPDYPRLHAVESAEAGTESRGHETNERHEISPATPTALFSGWVRFRGFGWQKVVALRREHWAREDLREYVEALGHSALDSAVTPEGQRP